MYVVMHYPPKDSNEQAKPLSVHWTKEGADREVTWFVGYEGYKRPELYIVEVDGPGE